MHGDNDRPPSLVGLIAVFLALASSACSSFEDRVFEHRIPTAVIAEKAVAETTHSSGAPIPVSQVNVAFTQQNDVVLRSSYFSESSAVLVVLQPVGTIGPYTHEAFYRLDGSFADAVRAAAAPLFMLDPEAKRRADITVDLAVDALDIEISTSGLSCDHWEVTAKFRLLVSIHPASPNSKPVSTSGEVVRDHCEVRPFKHRGTSRFPEADEVTADIGEATKRAIGAISQAPEWAALRTDNASGAARRTPP